ncbi:MAG: hypothetical protein QHH07_07775, partial [Sedimentisphaerales bacterium]|nr:hypothetical protein [Sedimentisphaerales bacterium]
MIPYNNQGREHRPKAYWLLWVVVFGAGLAFGQVPQQPKDANDPVGAVCSLIYKGDFAGAGALLARIDPNGPLGDRRKALEALLGQYDQIHRSREAARQKTYDSYLRRLERLRTGKPSGPEPNQPEDDIAEPNSIRG